MNYEFRKFHSMLTADSVELLIANGVIEFLIFWTPDLRSQMFGIIGSTIWGLFSLDPGRVRSSTRRQLTAHTHTDVNHVTMILWQLSVISTEDIWCYLICYQFDSTGTGPDDTGWRQMNLWLLAQCRAVLDGVLVIPVDMTVMTSRCHVVYRFHSTYCRGVP